MDVLDVASDAADAAELPQSFAAIREDISHIATAGWTNLDKLGQAEYPTGGYLLVRTVWHVAHTADTNQFTTRFTTRSADYAAMKAAEAAGFSVTPAIRRDFDHLSQLAEAQRWDDDTPVSPGVFGPLWPEGLPKGWPVASHIPQWTELVVEAFACERATEKMLEDDLVNLFHVLNRYYIVRSGSRLTLDQFNSLLPALVPAEV
ncbi:hypothetical protein C1280_36820 [Gemmata obscuriglobus]|uniref:DinB family protein n=2 Tax=Gemmata obscuriglobus TaxID=114 RepID=A0A2Z3HKK0_9BACT|nr:hypothetical protein C1280_36820 [Gemmata obscuriglobus]